MDSIQRLQPPRVNLAEQYALVDRLATLRYATLDVNLICQQSAAPGARPPRQAGAVAAAHTRTFNEIQECTTQLSKGKLPLTKVLACTLS